MYRYAWSSSTKTLTGSPARAAVDSSIADIRKQPSPVSTAVGRPGTAAWAPSAAGIDQPIAWLSVGLNYVRGRAAVYASAARCSDTDTSTNSRPYSGNAQR